MKKLIITSAIILSASLSFYAKQAGTVNTAQVLKDEKLSLSDNVALNFKNSQRMDIGQADIK